jgi:hypothetical protein
MKRAVRRGIAIALGVCLAGCNMVRIATNQTADVLAVAAPSMAMESDVDLAREAAPGQLKTVEGFYLASPENRKLMRLLAQGYCEYSFGFLDSDLEALTMAGRDDEQTAKLRQRATGLYQRCMSYGLKLLGHSWEPALKGDLAEFRAKVGRTNRDHVEGMFFTALGLASAININRDNLAMVADLPRAKMMFERIIQLDEKFYNAGAHTALGMLYASQGAAVGGNPTKGREHFDRAIALTGGKFLMPKVLKAQTYAVTVNDRKLFHDSLVEVQQASPTIWPEQRLANELARLRANRYLAHEADLF